MKVQFNLYKHTFTEMTDWLLEKLPKTELNEDRWELMDVIDDTDDKTLYLRQVYVSFKDDREAMMFMLRWS